VYVVAGSGKFVFYILACIPDTAGAFWGMCERVQLQNLAIRLS